MSEGLFNINKNYMHLRFLAQSAFENATASVEKYIYLYDNFNGVNPAAMLVTDRPEFINRQTICVGILAGEVEIMVDGKIKAMGTPSALKHEFGQPDIGSVFTLLARQATRSSD